MSVLSALVPILLQCCSRSTLPDPLESLHSVLVRIGEDLLQQTSSRSEFWFFKDSDVGPYFEALMEKVIGSFTAHPKLLIEESSDFDGQDSGVPTLAIVFLGSGDMDILKQLGSVNIHTKLVVVFAFSSIDNVSNIVRKLIGLRMLNTLYVTIYEESNKFDLFNYYVHRDELQVRQQYESLEQVFPEQTDLEGQTVDACTQYGASYSELDDISGELKGLDVQLVRIITKSLNGTLNIKFLECTPEEGKVECFKRRLDTSKCLFNFGHWELGNVSYGVPLRPFYSQVLIVPRGEPLNIYQLMGAPFTHCLWHFIAWTLCIGLCVKLLLNDRLSHHLFNVSWNKTFTNLMLLGFSLVTFVTLSGYEAKLVSFLSNWPNKPDITRIEELRAAGIKIVIETLSSYEQITNDPRLVGILEVYSPFSNFSFGNLTPNTGLLVEYGSAKRMYNYISKANQNRYMIFDERLETTLHFYHFGYRNSITKHFSTLLNRLYEAGIDQHWKNICDFDPEFISDFNSSNGMITYGKLKLLIPVVKQLWTLSIFVFLLELIIPKFFNKFRNHKVNPAPRKRAHTYPLQSIRRLKLARKSF